MNNYLVDFNPYYKPEEVKGYELFIGPEGEYYKVKTKYESADNITHYKWAEAYIDNFKLNKIYESENQKHRCKTPLEFLINYCGFIRYTHAFSSSSKVFLSIPSGNHTLPKKQIDSVYNIMYYNKDTIDEDIIKMLEDIDYKYDMKRDKVFENLKGRNR